MRHFRVAATVSCNSIWEDNMKNNYETPNAVTVKLDAVDVITTSPVIDEDMLPGGWQEEE